MAKICLCMIVKNEAHIIKECLQSVVKYIDYYAINDTGSTDGTQDVIKDFFAEYPHIRGIIVNHEFRTCQCHPGQQWKRYDFFHFGWNRTYSLRLAEQTPADYIFIMDADDFLVGELPRDKIISGIDKFAPAYKMYIKAGTMFLRTQLVRNDRKYNWRYEGALHEYITGDVSPYQHKHLPGDYHIEGRHLGARSQVGDKYLRDARVFEALLTENPYNDRNTFYCAQSWFSHGDYIQSMYWYMKRLPLAGYIQEKFNSRVRIAQCLSNIKADLEIILQQYRKAVEMCPGRRSECYYDMSKILCDICRWEEAYNLLREVAEEKIPADTLFVEEKKYGEWRDEVLQYCARKIGKIRPPNLPSYRIMGRPETDCEKKFLRWALSKIRPSNEERVRGTIFFANSPSWQGPGRHIYFLSREEDISYHVKNAVVVFTAASQNEFNLYQKLRKMAISRIVRSGAFISDKYF